MKFVADECVYGPIITRLCADGHEVISVKDVVRGSADLNVLALAVQENAILITQDRDFGELVYRQQLKHLGVILLRLASIPAVQRVDFVSLAILEHGNEMENAFTVMTPGGIRIRKNVTQTDHGSDQSND